MAAEATADVALAGQRLKQRVLLALVLSSVLPLLVLAYLLHAYRPPDLEIQSGARVLGLHFLALFTLLAMAVGGWVIWDLGRAVARMAGLIGAHRLVAGLDRRRDELGTLAQSLTRMLDTIERQAREINELTRRLDTAYKDLEVTNSRLTETSFKDEVTGLYNRRFFSLRLEEEMARFRRFNHPVSVVLLDLDGFKAVNDDRGHAAGDETLRQVAQILVRYSRGINVLARYGGDEFAVLLVETPKAGARVYADRIRGLVAGFVFSHGKPLSASFGVATLPDDDGASADELLQAADAALYVAKRAGKNRVVSAGSPAPTSAAAPGGAG